MESLRQSAASLIQSIQDRALDVSLLDEDEPVPETAVVSAAVEFVSQLFPLLEGTPPISQVGTFFGEMNITWRSNEQIVRLAFFPDRPTLLVFGSHAEAVGSFRSQPNPSPSEVAAHLAALMPALAR